MNFYIAFTPMLEASAQRRDSALGCQPTFPPDLFDE